MAGDVTTAVAFLKQKGIIDKSGRIWISPTSRVRLNASGMSSSDIISLAYRQGFEDPNFGEAKQRRQEKIDYVQSLTAKKEKTQPVIDTPAPKPAKISFSRDKYGNILMSGDRPATAGEIIKQSRQQNIGLAELDPYSVASARVREDTFVPTKEGTSNFILERQKEDLRHNFESYREMRPSKDIAAMKFFEGVATADKVASKVVKPASQPTANAFNLLSRQAKKQKDFFSDAPLGMKQFFSAQSFGIDTVSGAFEKLRDKPVSTSTRLVGDFYGFAALGKVISVVSKVSQTPIATRALRYFPVPVWNKAKDKLALSFAKNVYSTERIISAQRNIPKIASLTTAAGLGGLGVSQYAKAENKQEFLGDVLLSTPVATSGYQAGKNIKIFPKGYQASAPYKWLKRNQFKVETGAPYQPVNNLIAAPGRTATSFKQRSLTGELVSDTEVNKKLFEAFPNRVYGTDIPEPRIDFDLRTQKPLRDFGAQDYVTSRMPGQQVKPARSSIDRIIKMPKVDQSKQTTWQKRVTLESAENKGDLFIFGKEEVFTALPKPVKRPVNVNKPWNLDVPENKYMPKDSASPSPVKAVETATKMDKSPAWASMQPKRPTSVPYMPEPKPASKSIQLPKSIMRAIRKETSKSESASSSKNKYGLVDMSALLPSARRSQTSKGEQRQNQIQEQKTAQALITLQGQKQFQAQRSREVQLLKTQSVLKQKEIRFNPFKSSRRPRPQQTTDTPPPTIIRFPDWEIMPNRILRSKSKKEKKKKEGGSYAPSILGITLGKSKLPNISLGAGIRGIKL